MTIRKGEDWGSSEPVPDDAVVVASDRDAAEVAASHRRANTPIPPMLLTGGDLARTLGGGGARPSERRTHLVVDLGAVLLDGKLQWFVAHLVARRSWLLGRVLVVANAAFMGEWNVAPRAHPGDGRLDLLDGDPSFGDRLKARRRLPLGTHVPHPAIAVRRTDAAQIDLESPTPIRLDGHPVGSARSISVRVEPSALDIWI
ncbi:MAG: hypothetical protein R2707_04330 [Acidimicrobiales bacterium]